MLVEQHKAYHFFSNSIRSEETRKKYMFYLTKYLEYLGCYDADILLQKSPRQTESELIEFIIKLRDQNKNYYAIQNYVTAVVSFFKINDVLLNKNKITKFMPEQKIRRKDRAYTYQEIHSLLEIADERMRAVILLLSSTGMRIGAIPHLRIGNLEKLGNTYKIIVYENSKEEYFTFTTPEPIGPEFIFSGSETVYTIEVPKSKTERKKLIDEIIGDNFPEEIKYYFKSHDELARRDSTFSYDDFVNYSIEELRKLSFQGGGSKTPGIWRDSDGKLRDKFGQLVSQENGNKTRYQ